jgi:predicted ribosome quality control (RQC) complex YloA/Tae2 family protein
LLENPHTQDNITVEIDPSLSWQENAERYYRLARKAKARQKTYESRQKDQQRELNYYQELVFLIEQSDTLDELEALREDLLAAGLIRAPKKGKSTAKNRKKADDTHIPGLLTLTSSDGFTVLVGKSSQANGQLVGKLAKPYDIWLHVHQMQGSHVLIKTDKQAVPDQTLLEAANLAVHFSVAKQGTNVPVVYTEGRYVRKIPGSYPGHVNYESEEGLYITVDSQLIGRLLDPPVAEHEELEASDM